MIRRRMADLLFIALLGSPSGGCRHETDARMQLARWVLSTGGKVTVVIDGQTYDVESARDLPHSSFAIDAIAWDIYPGDRNDVVTDSHLIQIGAITELRSLDLWACGISDEGLRSLSNLKQLEQLQLNQTLISDRGLAYLEPLNNLRQLGLIGTSVTPARINRLRRERPGCVIMHLAPVKQ
jgi:hypothetical protein